MNRSIVLSCFLVLTLSLGVSNYCTAATLTCPFCNAESRTLSEELHLADAVVFARLSGPKAIDADSGNAKFKIAKVLSGEEVLGEKKEIDTVFFGEPDTKQLFMVSGVGTDYTEWATPLPLTAAAQKYVEGLTEVPATGADRLAFFQEYLENSEPLLAQDAYEEFARAPYADLHELKPRIHHDKLVQWIKDPEISPTRRRLYLTMLGVAGSKDDLPMLEEMIVSGYEDQKPLIEPAVVGGLAMGGPLDLPTWTEFVKLDERRKKLGMDALVACYMVLRGPDGLNLIDEKILRAKNTGYSQEVYSTIMALRFMGEETQIVPRERLLESLRILLDNPEFADQIVTDLSRWEDWSVMDRLVTMFKNPGENSYIRPPIVVYLMAAMEQPDDVGAKAKLAMADIEKVDPDVVKRAKATAAFGLLQRARSVAPAAGAQRPADAGQPAKEPAPESEPMASTSSKPAPINDASSALMPPDPATFGGQITATFVALEDAKSVDDNVDATPAPSTTNPTTPKASDIEAKSVPVGTNVAQVAQSSKPAAVRPMLGTTVAFQPSPQQNALVVGIPLASVVLLVGVYWTILRSGAV